MDDLQEKINSVLSDPAQLQQVFDFAKTLGLEPPPVSAPSPSAADASAPPELGALLAQAGRLDHRQENLLAALKPFLKPARREKVDRAMQAARLSQLAGMALRGRETANHKEGSDV